MTGTPVGPGVHPCLSPLKKVPPCATYEIPVPYDPHQPHRKKTNDWNVEKKGTPAI